MLYALKARYVFPASAGPIADGMVAIQGELIQAVGKDLTADSVEDLGNVAILPGLVNAHTHLAFSALKKPLGTPGIGFVDWLYLIRLESLEVRIQAVKKGINECIRCGTTTIGEIAQPDWLDILTEQHTAEGTAFLELIAPTADRVPAALELANNAIGRLGATTNGHHASRGRSVPGLPGSAVACVQRTKITDSGFRIQHSELGPKINPEPRTPNPEPSNWQFGLSPHAPYSVHCDLLQKTVELSVRKQIPLAMHLAESREELQWLAETSGPFKKLMIDLGAYDPTAVPEGLRPLDYLQMLAVAARALVIHGNYLTHDEIGLLADMADSMAVVYCPRSHEFFGHDRYPLEQMLTAGVTVCLGTDSRASAPDLDLLAEIRHVARNYPQLSPQDRFAIGHARRGKGPRPRRGNRHASAG